MRQDVNCPKGNFKTKQISKKHFESHKPQIAFNFQKERERGNEIIK